MHYFSRTLSLLFSTSLLYAEASLIPTSPAQRGELIRGRQIQELMTPMNYCLGIDSICTFANNFAADCASLLDSTDLTQYYECICGNGYISANQE
jgi:hypothetical protein